MRKMAAVVRIRWHARRAPSSEQPGQSSERGSMMMRGTMGEEDEMSGREMGERRRIVTRQVQSADASAIVSALVVLVDGTPDANVAGGADYRITENIACMPCS
jgi:hypothetical protein